MEIATAAVRLDPCLFPHDLPKEIRCKWGFIGSSVSNASGVGVGAKRPGMGVRIKIRCSKCSTPDPKPIRSCFNIQVAAVAKNVSLKYFVLPSDRVLVEKAAAACGKAG